MKTFKDYLHSDIPDVFVDITEHGDVANINGVDVNVVWDGDTLNYRVRTD